MGHAVLRATILLVINSVKLNLIQYFITRVSGQFDAYK